jgi:hypothetical protein
MPLIPVKVEDLPLYARHYFISFGERFVPECVHCSAMFDMPSASEERCRKREQDLRNWGDPFRPDPTH